MAGSTNQCRKSLSSKNKNVKYSLCVIGYTKKLPRGIFIIDSTLKTNPWIYKRKDRNDEKIIRSFHEKELLLSIL